MGQNADCTVPRGARYKVYEPTNTSQLQAHHHWHPEASRASLGSARRSSRFSARARIGERSGMRVAIDIASTTVKSAFNADSRSKSQPKLQVCSFRRSQCTA